MIFLNFISRLQWIKEGKKKLKKLVLHQRKFEKDHYTTIITRPCIFTYVLLLTLLKPLLYNYKTTEYGSLLSIYCMLVTKEKLNAS